MFGQPKGRKLPQEPKAKNQALYCIVIAVLMLVALISGRLSMSLEGEVVQSDAEFQVHVIDVGQGDSILILADGHAMLLDSGIAASGAVVARYLDTLGIEELDYVAASHLHADHIGGFVKALADRKVGAFLEPPCPDNLIPTGTVYEMYLSTIEQSGAELREIRAGDSFTLGGAEVAVLAPGEETPDSLNNDSLVFQVKYGDTVCLFTGDMESEEEAELLERETFLKADFLKVAHHGSGGTTGEDFLARTAPKYAVISCGKDNSYGHPAKSTLERLDKYAGEVYVTTDFGNVVYLYDADTRQRSIVTSKKPEETT